MVTFIDNKGLVKAGLVDLSKVFDTINHELLLVKLNVHGFVKQALLIIHIYLKNRQHREKASNKFSSWRCLFQEVSQGSILGHLLFDIYLTDLFLFLKDVNFCKSAEDATPFLCDKRIENVLKLLEENVEFALYWLENNYKKLNTDKYHLLTPFRHQIPVGSYETVLLIQSSLSNQSGTGVTYWLECSKT